MRADAVRNREALVQAALDLIDEHPNASMQEIADAAGVTRMTAYRHFATREALQVELATRLGRRAEPLVDEMRALPLGRAFEHMARTVVAMGVQYHGWLDVTRADEMGRIAVADEPILPFLQERRAAGEITTTLSDRWLAVCVRRLCITGLNELAAGELPTEEVERSLALSLHRLTQE